MDSRQQFEEWYKASGMTKYKETALAAWEASRELLVIDIRYAAKKWFYESFDDELLEHMQIHGLIAQAEGFSISVMADLELEMEMALNINGIRTK
jgi:hypothetical protein